MKIIIPPYPNYRITEKAFNNDVVKNSTIEPSKQISSNNIILTLEFKNGAKKVVKARPVEYKNKKFITTFPNPVHIFLSLAVHHFNFSEKQKGQFLICGKRVNNSENYILGVEENGTHDCYNTYIAYRMSSIIMLVSSIEAFMNHIIPNDFIYKTARKNRNTGLQEEVNFDKADIESPKVSFREKLTIVIPQWLSNESLWSGEEKNNIKESILELYKNRKNLIHLKTNSEDGFNRYFPAIDKMLDFNIGDSIDNTVKLMNTISKDFVEFEEE